MSLTRLTLLLPVGLAAAEDCDILVPEDHATIQEALDAAVDGDRVCVSAGVYNESLTVNEIDDLSLVGVDGSGTTAIWGDGTGPVLTVDGCEGLSISGLTLTGGASTNGGGLYLEDSSAELWDLVVRENEADTYGGGIFVYLSEVVARDLLVWGNTALGGAGIMVHTGSLELSESMLLENRGDGSSTFGGGMLLASAEATLRELEFYGNEASDASLGRGGGGAICVSSNVALEANNLILADNHAPGGRGGALYFVWDSATARLSNLTVVGNSALNGGAVFGQWTGLKVVFDHSIFAHNRAEDSTGGIWAYLSAKIDVSRSAFFDNRAGDGYTHLRGVLRGVGLLGNVEVDPKFMGLWLALDSLTWDLHLSPGSPLIDAGAPTLTELDGSVMDIGAYGGFYAGASYYDDADADGMWDGWERAHGLDPSADDTDEDADADGLSNVWEMIARTLPDEADMDADGYTDGEELRSGRDPANPDG